MSHTHNINDTEITRVIVTCEFPYEASKIANTITQVFTIRVTEIIQGSLMDVVDTAMICFEKVTPNITQYTAE